VAAVFRPSEAHALTGWDDWQLRTILRHHSGRDAKRYHLYRLRIKPDGEAKEWVWDLLRACPEVERGVVAVRAGNLRDGRANYVRDQLLRENYIEELQCVYVVNTARQQVDPEMREAIANVEMGRWVKVRNLVDALPEY
jgi:hypothetical protein